MREPGFYWVAFTRMEPWVVAEWYIYQGVGHWSICGSELDYKDGHFAEINERRIVREEPQ
jgi:hypothetical protein